MTQPLKILFLTHGFYPAVGGTEANAEFLAQAFTDFGANVHLVTWTSSTGSKTFPYKVIRNPGWGTLLREHRWADVVFENNLVLRLSWPSLLFKKPLVVALNTWINDQGGNQSLSVKLKYKWLKRASAVIAVSDALRKKCWPEALVIENAYDDKVFFNTVPLADRDKTFVFLGRLVSDKGADLAIEAVSRLKNMAENGYIHPFNNTLTIIGDGKDGAKLKEQVNELHLNDKVFFAGSLRGAELVALLNQHRYLLVPSVWREPFGIVALEGLACGCVPVVSDGGGLPDAVGKAGLVFKRGDVDDLVNKILDLLKDNALEDGLRSAVAAHLEAHTPQAIGTQYYNTIQSAVNKLDIRR